MMRPDWDKITEEAFNSEEVHDFSADYCRRRAELQGGTSMEKRRITQKTRRFNTRIAATAAALLIIPTATVGALHFAPSGDKNDGKKLGAAVEEATGTSAATEADTGASEVTAVTSEAVTEALTTMAAAEQETTAAAPEQETTMAPEGAEVNPATDSEDPSYLGGNYQMVFRQAPEGFVGIDGGAFCQEFSDECITPSWFYNVEGSYKRIFAECEKEMKFTGTVTYNNEYGTRECDVFVDTKSNATKYLIKFENTNFVGVLDIESGIDGEAISNFINAIEIRTKAELDECSDDCILVGGNSTNGLSDPEAAMLDSDVFMFSAQVDMVYDLKVNYSPAGYNLDRKDEDSWIYSNPSDNHSIYFTIYNYGAEAYRDRLMKYLTSNSANDFLDHAEQNNAGSEKQVYICYRKEGPYNGETQEEWNKRKTNGWDNRDVIIFNGTTGYAINFTVNDHMSDEELEKVIDGIEFVKRDTPRKTTSYLPWLIGSDAQ